LNLTIPTDPGLHILFDLLAWASAGLLARWLYVWRLKAVAAETVARIGPYYVVALALGAIAGAWGFGSWNTAMAAVPHPSHSVAGALAGGIVGVEIYKAARGITGSTGAIWVGPLALGIAVGRWGCLFAGLSDETYGLPTNLPWAVDLGDGVPRHPVQIYESLAMLAFLAVYLVALARRAAPSIVPKSGDRFSAGTMRPQENPVRDAIPSDRTPHWTRGRAFYLFVLFYAAQRFVWEFFKPYPDLIGPLNLFQLLALAMIVYALWFDARARGNS
jgi:phosphatidylglycerol:prolipoprotein diacylglycerol transferase